MRLENEKYVFVYNSSKVIKVICSYCGGELYSRNYIFSFRKSYHIANTLKDTDNFKYCPLCGEKFDTLEIVDTD